MERPPEPPQDGAPGQRAVTLRFYEELGFFLKPEQRKRPFTAAFHPGDTVKYLIEAIGVPHTEVDLILVDGRSVPFSYRLQGGEHISVYPVFESLDVGSVTRVRPQPLREPRFVLDVHLGRLAKSLRMLGFDTLYNNYEDDRTLSEISSREGRILLSRDRELFKRTMVTHGYCVRATRPREQLAEVIRRFDLAPRLRPFRLCLRCNEPLQPVEKSEVLELLPPRVAEVHDRFRRCPSCGQVYWRGTHWENMRAELGL